MVTGGVARTGRGLLLRSLPVLFALFLALFAAPAGTDGHRTASTAPAASGPVIASCVRAERVARTAEASPAATTAEPVAETPAATTPAVGRARALTAQRTASVAGSRAPPFAA